MKSLSALLCFLFPFITALAHSGNPSIPSPDFSSLDTIALDTMICIGDSVQLQLPISGANGIQWQPANGLSCSDCPNPATEPLFGDQSFTATGLDGQGNPFSYEYYIYVRSYLDFSLLLFSNSPVCEGDTLVFDPHVGGAQSYTWTNPNQEVFSTEPFPAIADITEADAGTYSLGLVDDLGCEAGASFDVQVYPSFTVSISTTGATCNGQCDGAASIDLSGVTPPYLVTWDEGLNWGAGTNLAGLCPGTYPFWVMDENCLQKLEVVIEEAEPLSASMNIAPPNCHDSDISIEIFNFSGGAGSGEQYFYSIDGGLTFQPTFDVPWQIPASTTSIVVADDAGCQVTYPIDVAIPEPIRVDYSIANASCITPDNGSIVVNSVTGGTPPYALFFGNDVLTTAVVRPGIAPGVYSLEIIDANACSVEFEVVISTNPIDAITNDTLICAGEQVELLAEAPGAVDIQWAPTAGLSAPNQLATLASPSVSTTYVLSVEDSEGCTGVDSVRVAVLPGLCREEWLDTLAVGQSGLWCTVAGMFGSPIPYGITGFTCGNGLGVANFEADTTGLCIRYAALQPGQDTLCVRVCELLDTVNCWDAFLFLTVTEQLVWPGDTDSSGLANHNDLLPIGLAYSALGPLRPNASLDWAGQPAPLWLQSTPASGINFRHADANGDGLVSAADTLALSLNWGRAREQRPGRPAGEAPPLAGNGNAPFFIQPDTLVEGATMQLPLILGTEEAQAADIYGLAFSLYFDEAVVKDGTAALVLSNSWLGDPAQDLICMQRLDDAAGRIDAGITRTNGQDAGGFGPIGELFITIEDDILALGRNWNTEALFEIRDVRVINFREEPRPLETPQTISPVLTPLREQPAPVPARLFPNPAKDVFYLQYPGKQIDQVQLLNVMGQAARSWNGVETGGALSLRGIVPGLYLVKVRAGSEVRVLWLVVE